MKKIFFVSVAMMILFSSCLHSFKKASDGIEYKIISSSDKKMKQGDFFELWSDEEYKDSKIDTILQTSNKAAMPNFLMLDSNRFRGSQYEILSQLGKGDSAVLRISTDTILKNQSPDASPLPFLRKGEYIVVHLKIEDVFATEAAADSVRKIYVQALQLKDSIDRAKQLIIDTKTIAHYLDSSKITAVKAPLGTFVSIQQQGTGKLIDTSNEALVIYTGTSFSGVVFDSNVDTSLHRGPIPVDMWAPRVIPAWPDGLKLLSKGAKATFYVPSSLAYGAHAQGPIQANENLIFKIEVVDVLSRAQVEAAQKAKEAEMQKQYMENMMRQQQMQQNQQH
jgi:FKBP-type peptidyl-prolyl cis-trans isomerase FkpA